MNDIIITENDDSNAIILSEPLPLDQNPAMVYIASLPSEHTRRNCARYLAQIANGLLYGRWHTPKRTGFDTSDDYRQALDQYKQMVEFFPWSTLRKQHTAVVRAKLMNMYKYGTANTMLSALRGTLKEAWDLGQVSAEDYQRAASVKNIKGKTLPAGRMMSDEEMGFLSDSCNNDDSAAGIRDAAIFGWMLAQGPRRAETASITREAVSLTKHDDTDAPGYRLAITHGKGDVERENFIFNGAYLAMTDWLELRGDEPGPLFLPINKAGAIQWRYDTDDATKTRTLRGMTSQAIYNMVYKRAEQSGLKNLSPHDMRRTVASIMIENSDIVTAQKTLGHASIETTARYDRRSEKAQKRASAQMKFSYKRRKKLV